jgi:hypothetical protein
VIPLKDGTSVVIFRDRKMSMRDKFGRAHAMPEGTIMKTADGQKIHMKGNEFWRKTTARELRALLTCSVRSDIVNLITSAAFLPSAFPASSCAARSSSDPSSVP